MTRDGRLVIDDPEVRRRLIKAIDSYTAMYRKGCTPPDLGELARRRQQQGVPGAGGHDDAELSLSIPNALKSERPDDYYENAATIEWPLGQVASHFRSMARSPPQWFSRGRQRRHRQGVRPLPRGRGLAMHYLDFSGERFLPTMSKLLDQPFWLDPSDPHRMASVMQVARGRWLTITPRPLATGGTSWSTRSGSGRRRSTASPPRASAPSRRSTRRSPASSRSSASSRHPAQRARPAN